MDRPRAGRVHRRCDGKGHAPDAAERHRHSRRSVITLVLVYLFLIAANVQGALGSMAEIDAGGEAARANVAAQYAELLAERDFGLPPGTAEAVSCGRAGGWLHCHGGRRRQDGAL